MLRLLPKLAVIVLRHLNFQKPLLGSFPDFDQCEVSDVFRVGEDVEQQAVRFVGAGGPDGAVALFPLLD
jgi:hypothetical protein